MLLVSFLLVTNVLREAYELSIYTSRGVLAGTRNSSMGPPWRIDPTHRTMSERSYHGSTSHSLQPTDHNKSNVKPQGYVLPLVNLNQPLFFPYLVYFSIGYLDVEFVNNSSRRLFCSGKGQSVRRLEEESQHGDGNVQLDRGNPV